MYTLAGIAGPRLGLAGIRGRSSVAARWGGHVVPTRRRDIATHLYRTERLRRGERPTGRRRAGRALGVPSRVLPMADEPVRTRFERTRLLDSRTTSSASSRRPTCARFVSKAPNARRSRPSRRGISGCRGDRGGALQSDRLDRADPGGRCMRQEIAGQAAGVRAVGVSGIVGGKALRGPADRMMRAWARSDALGVARVCVGAAARYVRDRPARRVARRRRSGAGTPGRGHRHVMTDVRPRPPGARRSGRGDAARRERPA